MICPGCAAALSHDADGAYIDAGWCPYCNGALPMPEGAGPGGAAVAYAVVAWLSLVLIAGIVAAVVYAPRLTAWLLTGGAA